MQTHAGISYCGLQKILGAGRRHLNKAAVGRNGPDHLGLLRENAWNTFRQVAVLFLAGATATSSSLDSRLNPYLGYLLIVRGRMHAVCTVLGLGTVASRARKLVSRQSK